jgi:hypothetical protein
MGRRSKAYGLQPHRCPHFKLSTDPQFVAKLRDVVGIYVDPPAHALVLSVAEKSQISQIFSFWTFLVGRRSDGPGPIRHCDRPHYRSHHECPKGCGFDGTPTRRAAPQADIANRHPAHNSCHLPPPCREQRVSLEAIIFTKLEDELGCQLRQIQSRRGYFVPCSSA